MSSLSLMLGWLLGVASFIVFNHVVHTWLLPKYHPKPAPRYVAVPFESGLVALVGHGIGAQDHTFPHVQHLLEKAKKYGRPMMCEGEGPVFDLEIFVRAAVEKAEFKA